MEPTPSINSSSSLKRHEQKRLLHIARESIRHGLLEAEPLHVDLHDQPPALHEPRATFVTLNILNELRGCIGELEARHPLAISVARNAFHSAFADPRFPPLHEREFPSIRLHISMLTAPDLLDIRSEDDLLEILRPGVDGLIIEEGTRRATFLPSVWESLPKPQDFLLHLKLKAGLPADYWSDTVRAWRYRAESIEE